MWHGATAQGTQKVLDDQGKPITGRPEPIAEFFSAAGIAQTVDSVHARVRGPLGTGHADEVVLSLKDLRFPPRDLHDAVAQQTLIFAAVREAVDACRALPRERTSVLIGSTRA